MDISTINLAAITDKNGNIDPKKLTRQIQKLQDREIKKHAKREKIDEAELREELRRNNNAAAKQSTFYRYETATKAAKIERVFPEIPRTYPKALVEQIKAERQRFRMRKGDNPKTDFSKPFKNYLKKARIKLNPESFRQYIDTKSARTHYARGSAMDIINELARTENAHKHIAEPNPPVFLFGSIEDTIEARDTMQNGEGLELLAGVMGVPMTLPTFDDISPEEVRAQFIADCVEFLKAKHGERLVSVVMHTDERLRKNHYGERSIKGEDLHFILKPCPSGEVPHAGKQAVKAFLDSAEGQILKAKLQSLRAKEAELKAYRSQVIDDERAKYAVEVRQFMREKEEAKAQHTAKLESVEASTKEKIDAIYKDRSEPFEQRKKKMAQLRDGLKKYKKIQNDAFYTALKSKPYPDKSMMDYEIGQAMKDAARELDECENGIKALNKEIKDRSNEIYKKAMSEEQQEFHDKVGAAYGLTRNGPAKKRYNKLGLIAFKQEAAEALRHRMGQEARAEELAQTNAQVFKNVKEVEKLRQEHAFFIKQIEQLKAENAALKKANTEEKEKFDYTAAGVKQVEKKAEDLLKIIENADKQNAATITEHYTTVITLAKRESVRRKRLEAMEAEEQKLLKQFTRADLSKPQPTHALGKIAASLRLTPKQKARARFAQVQRIKGTLTAKQKAATAANYGILGGPAVFLEALKAEQNGQPLDYNDYRKMLGPEIKAESDTKLVKAAEQTIEEKNKQLQQARKMGELKERALMDVCKALEKHTGKHAEMIKLEAIARNNNDRINISNTAPQRPTQARPQAAGALIANTQQTASTYIQPRRPRM
ncbi:hypothetical protein [Limnobacter sp.]|uniref:hypothetical protein n=1 Tax=Limnobacter sp. TaxID=2003368 RepID=UPI0027B9D305|nr:hypothetical protein [Limnobacter sp.]